MHATVGDIFYLGLFGQVKTTWIRYRLANKQMQLGQIGLIGPVWNVNTNKSQGLSNSHQIAG